MSNNAENPLKVKVTSLLGQRFAYAVVRKTLVGKGRKLFMLHSMFLEELSCLVNGYFRVQIWMMETFHLKKNTK